jgi:hypothetical protein
LISWSKGFSQKLLILSPEKITFSPSFSIVKVTDARILRENMGQIFVSANQKEPIGFKGGTEAVIKKFLLQSLPNKENQLLLRYRIINYRIEVVEWQYFGSNTAKSIFRPNRKKRYNFAY